MKKVLLVALLAALAGTASAQKRPSLQLQFESTMRAANGFGHDGDGCVLARDALANAPVLSKVWFDAAGQRLAQTNPGWRRVDPYPNLTVMGLYKDHPPTEFDFSRSSSAPGGFACRTEPLPPGYLPAPAASMRNSWRWNITG